MRAETSEQPRLIINNSVSEQKCDLQVIRERLRKH